MGGGVTLGEWGVEPSLKQCSETNLEGEEAGVEMG